MPRLEIYDRRGKIVAVEDTRTLEGAVAELHANIDALRDRLIERTFVINDIPVQLDARSRANITALGAAALARVVLQDPTPFPFRDEANIVHKLPPADMLALAMAALAHVSAVYQRAWTLKDDAAAKRNLVQLDAMDITQAWPE